MAKFVELKTKRGLVFINIEDISYILANANSTSIFIKSGEEILITEEYSDVSSYISWVADGCPELSDSCEYEDLEPPDETNNNN